MNNIEPLDFIDVLLGNLLLHYYETKDYDKAISMISVTNFSIKSRFSNINHDFLIEQGLVSPDDAYYYLNTSDCKMKIVLEAISNKAMGTKLKYQFKLLLDYVNYHMLKDQIDINVNYYHQDIIDDTTGARNYRLSDLFEKAKESENIVRKQVVSCSRIASPLFEIDPMMINLFVAETVYDIQQYKDMKIRENQAQLIFNFSYLYRKFMNRININPNYNFTTTMTSILNFVKDDNHQMTYLSEPQISMVKNLISLDIKTTMVNMNIEDDTIYRLRQIKIHRFYRIMQKYRETINIKSSRLDKIDSYCIQSSEITVTSFNFGMHVVYDDISKILMLKYGGYVIIQDFINLHNLFIDQAHLDYLISAIEIQNNLDIIIAIDDHENLRDILTDIRALIYYNDIYDNKVAFMKMLEPICLMKSDFVIPNTYKNWNSVEKVIFDNGLTNLCPNSLLMAFIGFKMKYNNHYLSIIRRMDDVTSIDLINLSAAHKYIYYSEINEDQGVEKYLKRTHTPRAYNSIAIKESILKFRQLFIFNYYQKTNLVPEISCDDELKYNIYSALETGKFKKLPLNLFSNVRLVKILDLPDLSYPFVYAKDKACSRNDVNFESDNINELFYIMKKPNYQLSDTICKLGENLDVKITRHQKLESRKDLSYATRLCFKEREQKKEGRLFGCATAENKHDLSSLNVMVEKVIDFFPGQFIKIKHEDKARRMHDAAQLLLKDDYYSILLDIEGHNQSIQPEIMRPFLKEIGDLFGKDDLDNAANYFTNLDVYYNYYYENKTIYSKGQRGGIEGWMNHLWTLMTLIYTELLGKSAGINVKNIMVYSDDVNIIVNMPDMDHVMMNETYRKLRDHYLRFGFTVKSSQTIISKNRSTLLRVHYHRGYKCEPSIKKLLSVSSLTEKMHISELQDIESLDAAVNSSIEDSNTVNTQLYMKWIKIGMISERQFVEYIIDRFDKIHISKFFSPQLISSIRIQADSSLHNMTPEMIYDTYAHLFSDRSEEYLFPKRITKLTRQRLIKLYQYQSILDYISKDKFCIMAYYIYLTLPHKLGGYAVSTLSENYITGHSNNTVRKLDCLTYLVNTSKFDYDKKQALYRIIFNNYNTSQINNEVKIFDDEFPPYHRLKTPKVMISSEIKKFIHRINVNIDIMEYMVSSKQKQVILGNIIDYTRDRFHSRLANFYREHSSIYLSDYLFKKVDTSKSFMRNHKYGNYYFAELYAFSRSSKAFVFEANFNSDMLQLMDELIYDRLSLLEFLSEIRRSNYPDVKFLEITEPSYYNKLSPSNFPTASFEAIKTTDKVFSDGDSVYKSYIIPNKMKVKYYDDDEFRGSNLYLNIALRMTMITKWIMLNDYRWNVELEKNNYVLLCNYCLGTMCRYSYDDLKKYVGVPIGGEILHRLEGFNFKARSYIKTLHKDIATTSVKEIQRDVIKAYENSNINFGLVKDMIRVKFALENYFRQKVICSYYYLDIGKDIVKDVAVRFSYDYQEKIDLRERMPASESKVLLEYRILCEDYTAELIRTKDNENEFRNYVIRYYRSLRRNYIFTNFTLSGVEYWSILYNQLKKMGVTCDNFDNFYMNCKSIVFSLYSDCKMGLNIDLENYLPTGFHYKESQIRDLIEKYQNVDVQNRLINIAFALRSMKESTEREAKFNELKNEIVQFHKQNDMTLAQILRNIVLSHIINHCIAYYIHVDKNIQINISKTIGNFKEQMEHGYYNVIDCHDMVIYCILDRKIQTKVLNESLPYITMVLELININLKKDIITGGEFNIKVERNAQRSPEDIPQILAENIAYNNYLLDTRFVSFLAKSKLVMDNIRRNLEVTKSPDAQFSLTASDSLTAGLGIVKYIMSLRRKFKICDLTAGRGDFNLAFEYFKVEVESYSTKNLFNNTYKSHRITYIDYDLSNYRSLGFVDHYSMIVIDISFVKGSLLDILGNIKGWIFAGKEIIIRFNSLCMKTLSAFLMENCDDISGRLLIPNGGYYSPYQMYLHLFKGRLFNCNETKDSNVCKAFNYYYMTTFSLPGIHEVADLNNYNSVNAKISISELNVKIIIANLKEYNILTKDVSNIERTISLITENNYLILRKSNLDLGKINTLKGIEKKYTLDNNLKGKFENIDYSQYDVVKMTDLTFEDISDMNNNIVLAQQKKLIRMINYLYKRQYFGNDTSQFLSEVNPISLAYKLKEIISNNEMFVPNSSYLYDIVLIMMYIVMYSDYNKTMNEIVKHYLSMQNRNARGRLHRIIRNTKCCSNKLCDFTRLTYDLDNKEKNTIITYYHNLFRKPKFVEMKNDHYDEHKPKRLKMLKDKSIVDIADAPDEKSVDLVCDAFMRAFLGSDDLDKKISVEVPREITPEEHAHNLKLGSAPTSGAPSNLMTGLMSLDAIESMINVTHVNECIDEHEDHEIYEIEDRFSGMSMQEIMDIQAKEFAEKVKKEMSEKGLDKQDENDNDVEHSSEY